LYVALVHSNYALKIRIGFRLHVSGKETVLRVKLLVATTDESYAGHLSNHISSHHADVIDVTVCRTPERFGELLKSSTFDAALLDEGMADKTELGGIRLPMLLWAEDNSTTGIAESLSRIRKYQRISSIVADVLEQYAKASPNDHNGDNGKARITAVWSPAGGTGKTTVALAYAAKKASEGKQVLYLDLEPFSSVPSFFHEPGKSISTVFEMLGTSEGSITTLIQGIRRCDSNTGISYFCHPVNFDDMNILSAEDVITLLGACSAVTEELVIDMSCVCDERTRLTFELADRIFIVTDPAHTVQAKLQQFSTQHNVFTLIYEKVTFIANKGATPFEPFADSTIRLPFIQSQREDVVYKALSGCGFESTIIAHDPIAVKW